MDALSALMLAIIGALLCLSIPRIYSDWLAFQADVKAEEPDRLPRLLVAENQWVQRHFWHAVLAVIMVFIIEATALSEMSPNLSQVTAVYATLSLTLAFVESLFAQKVASVLALVRGSSEDEPSEL